MVSVDVDMCYRLSVLSKQLPVPSMRFWKLVTGNWKLDAETRPAPARALGVRVVEDEALADQARVVVECGPVDEPEAPGVDEYLRAVRTLEYVIAVPGGSLPGEHVTET